MPSQHLQGLDSLLSTVQMPGGIPVATFAIGDAGAKNAALFAVAILAAENADLRGRLADFRRRQAEKVAAIVLPESG
jgi:5-(carboxyamino)imidazole ribonucleotide mutase